MKHALRQRSRRQEERAGRQEQDRDTRRSPPAADKEDQPGRQEQRDAAAGEDGVDRQERDEQEPRQADAGE